MYPASEFRKYAFLSCVISDHVLHLYDEYSSTFWPRALITSARTKTMLYRTK